MLTISRYTVADEEVWNAFVETSKNGTFLFGRRYMDYHRDRFTDHSLMVWLDHRLIALLPADIKGNTLRSHGGLTYGGLVTDRHMTTELALETFNGINSFLASTQQIDKVVYKPTPWIYHDVPAEEDLYALTNVCHARLSAREVSTAVSLPASIKISEQRRRGRNKAMRNGVEIKESQDLESFWTMLRDNLESRHHVAPVHPAEELELLARRFPRHIHLFTALKGEKLLGGTLVFDCGKVIHTQYIASTEEGKKLGALDLLFSTLVSEQYADHDYLDFGKSTEHQGTWLNKGLIHQKEGFGGRAVCYDTYEWDIKQQI